MGLVNFVFLSHTWIQPQQSLQQGPCYPFSQTLYAQSTYYGTLTDAAIGNLQIHQHKHIHSKHSNSKDSKVKHNQKYFFLMKNLKKAQPSSFKFFTSLLEINSSLQMEKECVCLNGLIACLTCNWWIASQARVHTQVRSLLFLWPW